MPENDEEQAIARAHGKYLYPKDLVGIIPDGSSQQDSFNLAQNYIDQWIRKQLMLKHAEFNLKEQNKDFSALIEDYRASLLIHEYQKNMLMGKVDTIVTADQIEAYYEKNLPDFKLSNTLVKALYIRIAKTNSRVPEIRQLLTSSNVSAFETLVELSYQYADRFDFFEDKWISLNQILQKIPGSPEDPDGIVQSQSLLEIENGDFLHFLQIRDYILSGETAPIEYLNRRIRDMVLTKRKLDYLKDLEESVYLDAVQKNDFEIYLNDK